NTPLAEAGHHVEVALVDVCKSDLDVAKLGNRKEVPQEVARKADAACADKRHLKRHDPMAPSSQPWFNRKSSRPVSPLRRGACDLGIAQRARRFLPTMKIQDAA